ncbi:MAG TPA: Hpt domain-containing protein [Candidatus Acidoferrum sp.]|jgi:HPt (histidine-containing phosphotransfer) domain-containing protein
MPISMNQISRASAFLHLAREHGTATMNDQKQPPSQPVWNLPELLGRVDNDQELLRDLLNIFKEDFPRTMRSLESAVAVADLKGAARLSHTLKGMLSSLGAMRASTAASRLEQLASAGETASLKDAFVALEREAATLLPEFNAYMAEVHH